jgi:hypothetical protein
MKFFNIRVALFLAVCGFSSASWVTDLFPMLGKGKASNEKPKETEAPTIVEQKPKILGPSKPSLPPRPSAPLRSENSSISPTKHAFDDFLLKKIKDNVGRLGKMTKLIFVGDSFFYKVSRNATRWNGLENSYAAINLGCPGDRTEHVLHRYNGGTILTNISSSSPLVITMIGTSNVNMADSPASIANGIDKVLSSLMSHLKNPQIIVLSLLPRSVKPQDGIVVELNKILQETYEKKTVKNVQYVDIFKLFMSDNNTVRFDLLSQDKIHPSILGQVSVTVRIDIRVRVRVKADSKGRFKAN